MYKVLLAICISAFFAGNATAAGLGGTVYVPNLHAKCLSGHQERMLECADLPLESGVTCAKESMMVYNECEGKLTRLRALDDIVPVTPKYQQVDEAAWLARIEKDLLNEKPVGSSNTVNSIVSDCTKPLK